MRLLAYIGFAVLGVVLTQVVLLALHQPFSLGEWIGGAFTMGILQLVPRPLLGAKKTKSEDLVV